MAAGAVRGGRCAAGACHADPLVCRRCTVGTPRGHWLEPLLLAEGRREHRDEREKGAGTDDVKTPD